jgi:hypothetical protein
MLAGRRRAMSEAQQDGPFVAIGDGAVHEDRHRERTSQCSRALEDDLDPIHVDDERCAARRRLTGPSRGRPDDALARCPRGSASAPSSVASAASRSRWVRAQRLPEAGVIGDSRRARCDQEPNAKVEVANQHGELGSPASI